MSGGYQPYLAPDAAATAPANGAHAGIMPRWMVADATHASFATQQVSSHSDLYIPLATAGVAGAMSAAQVAKLATLKHPTLQLSYAAAADLANGFAATAATGWFQIMPDQTFASTATTAWQLIEVRGAIVVNSAGLVSVAARLLLDGANPVPLPGTVCPAGAFALVAVSTLVVGTNFNTASHTVRLQLQVSGNATINCRAASNPPYEFMEAKVVEIAP